MKLIRFGILVTALLLFVAVITSLSVNAQDWGEGCPSYVVNVPILFNSPIAATGFEETIEGQTFCQVLIGNTRSTHIYLPSTFSWMLSSYNEVAMPNQGDRVIAEIMVSSNDKNVVWGDRVDQSRPFPGMSEKSPTLKVWSWPSGLRNPLIERDGFPMIGIYGTDGFLYVLIPFGHKPEEPKTFGIVRVSYQ